MTNNNVIEVQLSKPERLYEKCYLDFMDTKLLNGDEKIIFLSLKRFLDVKKDLGEVYPSIEKIAEMTGYTRKKVIKNIKSLVDKKIINVKRRGLTLPNLYTLNDTEQMWKCESLQELAEVVNEKDTLTVEQHIEALKKQGYDVVINKKEAITETDQSTDMTSNKNTKSFEFVENNTTPNLNDCQTVSSISDKESQEVETEHYTHEQIKELYEYDIMVYDEPEKQSDIDNIIEILHNTLNTTKPTIRIGGQAKSTKIVISKLLKLDKDCLLYAIDKFKEQIGRIKNPTSYMLTLLYNSKEQMNLDVSNRVQHDMYNNAIADNGISSNCDTQKYDVVENELTPLEEFTEQKEYKTQISQTGTPRTQKTNKTKFHNFQERNYDEEQMKEFEIQSFHQNEKKVSERTKEQMERLREKYPNLRVSKEE